MKQGHAFTGPGPVAAALLAVLLLPAPALGQNEYNFAIGAGGSIVNDSGTAAKVKSFGTAGAHLFGELRIDRWGILQARFSHFGLPGTRPAAPNLRADVVTLTVGYVFREEWWRAGLYVGGGGYRLEPRNLETGQVQVDGQETVFGWTGGLLSIFDLTPRLDLRLELAGHVIRSDVEHKPIFISAGLAYHF